MEVRSVPTYLLFSSNINLGFTVALSIFCSAQHNYMLAYVLIFLGYEFDRFDGIVARMMDQCSEWGKQLDSLSDLVNPPPPQ